MPEPSMAKLIDILKMDKKTPVIKDWSELEDHVQHVYQTLLNLEGEDVRVARNMQVQGRGRSVHQIDVYYEFKLAGTLHRVAIECKNAKRPIELNDVRAFKSIVDDCLGLQGLMIAANGFQSGAKDFAEDNGVAALKLEDLPSIANLLGRRLASNVMPDSESIGQPFWTIYDLKTFAPYGEMASDGKLYGFLFYSKNQAQRFLKSRSLPSNWSVRGMAQIHLRCFILVADAMRAGYMHVVPGIRETSATDFLAMGIARADLIAEYCGEKHGLPAQPIVIVRAI